MSKYFLTNILAPSLILTLSACSSGGGGSGSSPSTAVPQYIKSPKANCGSKDCFSGAAVSSQSIGTLSAEGDSAYQDAKIRYSDVKTVLTNIKNVVDLLNAAADDNDITSCDDIPTSGTFTFGSVTYTLEPGGESWNIGGSAVPMSHKITGVSTGATVQYNFNCDTAIQRLHVIQSSSGTKTEIYSEINLSTGETKIEAGQASSSGASLFYFHTNGGDKFTLANLLSDGSSAYSLLATSDVLNPPQTDPESQYIEVVRSGASNADLDTADWGFNLHGTAGGQGNSYRGCIGNYRSSSATSYDNSCNASSVDPVNSDWGTQYALLSNLPPLLVGDGIAVNSWSVVGLEGLTIP
ncbi:MAG: hypothetical protein KF799_11905 [Bdellovibrionales bacterium]|nr:hypothetical protein [Bdellovibrionales bacterium]